MGLLSSIEDARTLLEELFLLDSSDKKDSKDSKWPLSIKSFIQFSSTLTMLSYSKSDDLSSPLICAIVGREDKFKINVKTKRTLRK